MIHIDLSEQVFHGRIASAVNRLNNLVTAKRTFITRMETAKALAKDAWQRKHTQDLIDIALVEIAEIECAAHDIRFIRERA
jgi:hypothetical protein